MKTTLKRIAAPKTWPILRKHMKYITRPKPSGQSLAFTLPIVVVLRDMLGLVDTARQARQAMREHDIRINGTRVYKTSAALGFMDVLSTGKDHYTLTIDHRGRLAVEETKDAHTVQKIMGKTHVKGGKVQLNFASGMNVLVEKDTYKTGDSIIMKDRKAGKHLPLKKGADVLVTGGHHMGSRGTIEKIDGDVYTVKTDDGSFLTTKDNIYVTA